MLSLGIFGFDRILLVDDALKLTTVTQKDEFGALKNVPKHEIKNINPPLNFASVFAFDRIQIFDDA